MAAATVSSLCLPLSLPRACDREVRKEGRNKLSLWKRLVRIVVSKLMGEMKY